MPASSKPAISGSPQTCRIECSPHVGASSAVVVPVGSADGRPPPPDETLESGIGLGEEVLWPADPSAPRAGGSPRRGGVPRRRGCRSDRTSSRGRPCACCHAVEDIDVAHGVDRPLELEVLQIQHRQHHPRRPSSSERTRSGRRPSGCGRRAARGAGRTAGGRLPRTSRGRRSARAARSGSR